MDSSSISFCTNMLSVHFVWNLGGGYDVKRVENGDFWANDDDRSKKNKLKAR